MQYKDISIEEFVALSQTHRIVIFGTGKLFQRAMPRLVGLGMNLDSIRLIMDNGHAGQEILACGRAWHVWSVEDAVQEIASDDVILFTPLPAFAAMAQQLESYGLENVACLYKLFDVWAMREQGNRVLYPTRRSDHPMIPKVIHCLWFGKNEIPDWQKRCIETWHKYCPDYEFRFWNEDNYDIHKCKYMEQAYEVGRLGFVPEYARIDILYQEGGIYLDTDVELVRPLDELLYQPAFCSIQEYGTVNFGSGFGCVPGLEIFREMRDEYLTEEFCHDDGTYNLVTCTFYQTRTLKRHGLKTSNTYQIVEDLTIYPADVFGGSFGTNGKRETTQNTYAIHLGAASWTDNVDAVQDTKRAVRERF